MSYTIHAVDLTGSLTWLQKGPGTAGRGGRENSHEKVYMVVLLRLYTKNAGEKTPVSVVRYPSGSSLLPNLRMPPLYSAGSGWPLHWTPHANFAV